MFIVPLFDFFFCVGGGALAVNVVVFKTTVYTQDIWRVRNPRLTMTTYLQGTTYSIFCCFK